MARCRDCKYYVHTLTGRRGGDYGYCDLKDAVFKANRDTYVYWREGKRPKCIEYEGRS